ncbi:MAG: glycoside hydrolase family 2 TIM barrel-domain containing protein [Thermofilaceae archaeon]
MLLLALLLIALLASPAVAYSRPLAPATLQLVEVDGVLVPLQNGVVYPTFAFQPSRRYIDLGGEWEILYDEEGGEAKFGGVRLSLAPRTGEVLQLLEQQMRAALARGGWMRTRVPSCNNARGSAKEGYQGVTWYRRVFEVTDGQLEGRARVFLVFHGVNYLADVWLNGVYLGYHEGGFTPFLFDATRALKPGLNELVVRVDNVPWGSPDSRFLAVPYAKCDWWNYGGIYREVYLEIVNSTYIARLDLIAERGSGWTLRARATIVSNGARRAMLKLALYPANAAGRLEWSPALVADRSAPLAELAREVELRAGISVFEVRLDGLEVPEWSPENPRLYVVGAQLVVDGLVVDELYEQFGFRTVGVSGGRITINGEPVFLRGVARHEDHPAYGRSMPPELIYGDLVIVKEVGANFLRTAHYPNHPLTYVYADRLGLLVWEEIPVYWFDCAGFRVVMERGVAEQMLLEMIFRDFNRPSIIIWSFANECACREERVAYLRRMRELAKRIDPTRLLTQAVRWDPTDDTSLRAGLDVLAVNMYFGVFYGRIEDLDGAIQELRSRYPSLPLLISEFGYWSGGGVGEAGQLEYFIKAWRIVKSRAGELAGAVWWTIFDYDSMIVFNTFGALDWHRAHRKLLYQGLREAYHAPLEPEARGQWVPQLFAVLIAASLLALVAARRFRKASEKGIAQNPRGSGA